jgi:hypothetical protein
VNNIAPHCNLLSIGKVPCGCEERSGHVQQAVRIIVAKKNGITIQNGKWVGIQMLILVVVL